MFIFSETTHVWLFNSIIVHWLTFKQLFIIITQSLKTYSNYNLLLMKTVLPIYTSIILIVNCNKTYKKLFNLYY